jgi:ABC-type transport system involved in cytochrome c biogenesis permease subunit
MEPTDLSLTPPADTPRPAPRKQPDGPLREVLRALASLRLTVVLFALAAVLVFLGTVAQADAGNWTVVKNYFRSAVVWVPFQVFVRFGQTFLFVPKDLEGVGSFPYPGGWLLGGLLLANLLAAHAVRFRVTWKRSGILILHSGLIVLMLSELVAGLLAVEQRMPIVTGGAANFALDARKVELAFIDSSDPKADDVVVIPAARLRQGGMIQHPDLPFGVRADRYMENSALTQEFAADKNPATAGAGQTFLAVEKPEVSGASTDDDDVPAAYVTLFAKGTDRKLGTYLVSRELAPQPVTVPGSEPRKLDLVLRYKVIKKPYTIHLLEFHHKLYVGTNTPKDFSSRIRLVDEDGNKREVVISMNDPLRYRGETFYQSGYLPDDKGTILQVVQNPGWLMPYIACALVAGGMLIHFGIYLVGFLTRLTPVRRAAPGLVGRYFPWAVVTLAAAFLLSKMFPPRDPEGAMQIREFAKLPVADQGRIKPIDTVARVSLMQINNRETWTDKSGQKPPPIKWLLDVMTSQLFQTERDLERKAVPALQHKVFRIENDQVLKVLGLKPRPGSYRYSLAEFQDKMDVLVRESERANATDPARRDLFDVKILELANRIQVYVNLARLKDPRSVPPTPGKDDWQPLGKALREMVHDVVGGRPANPAAQQIRDMMLAFSQGRTKDFFHLLEDYRDLPAAKRPLRDDLVVGQFGMLAAYANDKASVFNRELAAYRDRLEGEIPDDVDRAKFEVFFNHFAPFYWCEFLYVLVFLLTCLSWLVWHGPLRRAAFWLAVLTFLVHSWALYARMHIQGRPPVTNLYSTAIYVGWCTALLALILEAIFRNSLGNLVAAVLGSLTVFISYHLAENQDTMTVMQAVLDTNFWLATHVVIINFGYGANAVAGLLGMVYVLLGFATPVLSRDLAKKLSQMIYGILCFATFLTFTGTVLGGIWADQSWGRFWGWDPKENGALLLVLWNVIILHARWAGIVKQRGVAALSVVGLMITGWSWFGTNQLGVGLHAYGFSKTLAVGLAVSWLIELPFLIAGLLPARWWWSLSAQRKQATVPVNGAPQR